jgi:hypothetical protein
MAKRGLDFELCTKCVIFLLKCHQPQILHTQSLLVEMMELQNILCDYIGEYKDLIGMNIAGLKNMNRFYEEKKNDDFAFDAIQNSVVVSNVNNKKNKKNKAKK